MNAILVQLLILIIVYKIIDFVAGILITLMVNVQLFVIFVKVMRNLFSISIRLPLENVNATGTFKKSQAQRDSLCIEQYRIITENPSLNFLKVIKTCPVSTRVKSTKEEKISTKFYASKSLFLYLVDGSLVFTAISVNSAALQLGISADSLFVKYKKEKVIVEIKLYFSANIMFHRQVLILIQKFILFQLLYNYSCN